VPEYRETMILTLQYFDGCPSWLTTERDLLDLANKHHDLAVVTQRVESAEDAERLGFRGSPTVLLDGIDLFPDVNTAVGLACRRYLTPDGIQGYPSRHQLREAILSGIQDT
jgi:hypothetical protein